MYCICRVSAVRHLRNRAYFRTQHDGYNIKSKSFSMICDTRKINNTANTASDALCYFSFITASIYIYI